jgi:hypothetical protein
MFPRQAGECRLNARPTIAYHPKRPNPDRQTETAGFESNRIFVVPAELRIVCMENLGSVRVGI